MKNVTKMGMIALAGILSTATLAHADFTEADSQAQATRVEAILGYAPDANGIGFQVKSGGCTKKEDFKIQVEKRGPNLAQLTLIRQRPDTCHAFVPMGERLYVTYGELGLNPATPFFLSNPNGIVNSWVWKE